jgi:hypothetical protein
MYITYNNNQSLVSELILLNFLDKTLLLKSKFYFPPYIYSLNDYCEPAEVDLIFLDSSLFLFVDDKSLS